MYCTSNLIIFRSDGLMASYKDGAMGRAHDSKVMHLAHLYTNINKVYTNFQGRVAADSAFLYKDFLPLIVKSSETAENLRSCASVIEAAHVTSARQSAKWGMADLKRGSPRLCRPLRYEERGERYKIMEIAIHLHNFQTNQNGISQIQTTYGGYWDAFTSDVFHNFVRLSV